MDHVKWERMAILLDTYGIKPLIAVIPNNMDQSQNISSADPGFWSYMKKLEDIGWEICMHGNTHVYHSRSGGINPVHKRSEFAGVNFDVQCEAIRIGFQKFLDENIQPRIFAAPSHTFDNNTLLALKKETPIRIISDTIAFNPYQKDDFIFIPQQFSSVRKIILPGLFTFSCHPGTMNDSDFRRIEEFMELNAGHFISARDLDFANLRNYTFADSAYSLLYFQFRKTFR